MAEELVVRLVDDAAGDNYPTVGAALDEVRPAMRTQTS